ncbi:MAG: hypothetical protein WBX15_18120 [Thermoanaerobaculia bacterium]
MLTMVLITCASTPTYNVVLRNATAEKITGAHVSYAGFRSVGGVLVPGAMARQALVQKPVPQKAKVEWRTADGQLHVKEVAVKTAIPERFSGDITFEILDHEQVRVSAQGGG